MSLNWNNVKPACCAKWLVLPTVYSDALSYGEQLDKFCYQLNQLIENNNILPDFIAEMIKEYINSGAIGEVVRDILADYILNVKYPPNGITPAVGDGSADDTEAIQGCIDYAAENGGVVYFPYGSYLTQPLTVKDGVSLFGFDRYSTKIVLKGGATKPLIGGSVADLSIANLTLDGNSGIQVNDVNVVTIIGTNVLLTNLIIKDGYTLVNYTGNGGHFQISDVVFGNSVKECLFTAGNAYIQCENVVFNHLSAVGGISVMDIGTDDGFFNVKSVATCNQCIVVTGNNNKISAIVENAAIPVVDNGLQNNIEIFGISNKEFYSNDTTKKVNGSYSKKVGGTYTKDVGGNANESVVGTYEKTVGGNANESVAGAYTKTVGGNSNESVDGNFSSIVTGVTTEIYEGNRTITEKSVVETGKKKTFDFNDIYFNTTEPIQYKDPVALSNYFKTIPFKDRSGDVYNVLVQNGRHVLDEDVNIVNVKYYGAVGDGVTDDSAAIKAAEVADGDTLYFPPGDYAFTGVSSAKNWVLAPGAVLVYNGTGLDTFLQLTGSNKVFNLVMDMKNKNPHYAVDVTGNENHFEYVEMRNMTYSGTQPANVGINLSGNMNTFDFVKAENFTQTGSGNDSCPQVIALVNTADKNFFADIYSHNVRATVVNASGGTKNYFGSVTCYDSHDNGIYTVRGGFTSVDTIMYNGDNECIAVITDSLAPNGCKSSVSVGTLIVNNCEIVLRVNVAEYVTVGTVIGYGSISKLLFMNTDTGASGVVKFGNVMLCGEIQRLFYAPSSRGSYEGLYCESISCYTKWRFSVENTLGSFSDMSAAKKLYIGSYNLVFVDAEDRISGGSRIYHLINSALSGYSFLGKIGFMCYKADGTTDGPALLAFTNVGQEKLTLTSGFISSGANRIELNTEQGNLNDGLYITNIPSAGYWRYGQFIRNINPNNRLFGWVCIEAGTPGKWVEVAYNPPTNGIAYRNGSIQYYNGTQWNNVPASTGDVRYSNNKLQYYNGSAWVNVS